MENEREYKLEHNVTIEYLLQNIVTVKVQITSLEYLLLAYIGLKTPELLDSFCDQLEDVKKKQFQKVLDDLSLLDQGLSDALRSILDGLNP
jgi:hypothetical protein